MDISIERLTDSPFFAPMAGGVVDSLVGEYAMKRRSIQRVAEMFAMADPPVVSYFLKGNAERTHAAGVSVEKLFQAPGAVAALNSEYWNRALALTDVRECMPQARRDEWSKHIIEMTAPDFEEETVRSTLEDLLHSREKFFAERVDGIFRKLSRAHVTNTPQGFGKRMIVAGVINSYGMADCSQSGYIDDLRRVIGKFTGRGDPPGNSTWAVITASRRQSGQWMEVDGGALRIRTYIVGTAHLEVHPDMAWKLNCVLASLYPAAIPSQFREPPKRKAKEYKVIARPLPHSVVKLIAEARPATVPTEPLWRGGRRNVPNTLQIGYGDHGKTVQAEALTVLAQIGGVSMGGYVQFDYDPTDVIDEIVCSGCVPDRKSHQFYPTPEPIAWQVIEMARIGPHDTCLEPSAGIGSIAELMPPGTQCVEISPLHCSILEAKGLPAECADFLTWSEQAVCEGNLFDVICANPPFSEGRALAHLQAAASLLKPGGRIVCVLPASMRGKELLPGLPFEWSQTFANEFDGTGVSVAIYAATRSA